ncbi:hypothetical protein I4F81_001584 [Pyropia yezoensis]|uniref:Uncharacterized protein n=1 Tax=Pyropia yezoensis TaxID=2788 RepID=A0ACC3BM33_PYRYE|nr:hypothetical protein I4F81_001584 [Neopyropia yezoensis]
MPALPSARAAHLGCRIYPAGRRPPLTVAASPRPVGRAKKAATMMTCGRPPRSRLPRLRVVAVSTTAKERARPSTVTATAARLTVAAHESSFGGAPASFPRPPATPPATADGGAHPSRAAGSDDNLRVCAHRRVGGATRVKGKHLVGGGARPASLHIG